MPGAPAGPVIAKTIDRDASTTMPPPEDEDAGTSDAGAAASFCSRVPAPTTDVVEDTTAADSPGDLTLTRQVERWSAGCDSPRLTLEFSDGYCPAGLGHTLSFSFSYLDLLDGAVHTGNNAIASETEKPAIRVRYTRPARLTPSGTWGTCEGASGQLVFLDEPSAQAGSYMQARFLLNLTACDGSGNDALLVQGTFKLLQHTSVRDACPNSDF